MRSVSATEAKQNFAAVLDSAQRGPVVIRRHDREIAAVVSIEDYERIRKTHVEDFLALTERTGQEAAARGMSEEVLARLLDDEPRPRPTGR
ncbi:MAG TPA: type II toxin-antitoxin system Phd/YefM family antitoxin [Acidobacteriaceae bacterium]|jgi:prevent-host-death family protein|nr:type II toxin-antitoxin system Phd/YefM family antitoxin [Acidobacteriaceae bacterium]